MKVNDNNSEIRSPKAEESPKLCVLPASVGRIRDLIGRLALAISDLGFRPSIGSRAPDFGFRATPVLFTLLALLSSASAQPLDHAIFSIGTTTTNAQGAYWSYLLWQPTEANALAGRKLALYAKQGAPDAPGNYERRTVTQRQTDPLVIQSILNRSINLGEDLGKLNERINAMFAAAVPQTNLSLAQKISAVIRGAQNDPKLLGNVIFLGRIHPALNLCLGHAWAEPVLPGKTTFEIRDFDLANNKDLGVIGRVTVDAAVPVILPAPGVPVKYPEQSAMGDLNIKLRWATPDALREVGLLQHGYNLYRMTKAFAESNNFHNVKPTRAQLRDLLAAQNGSVKRINETPIVVNKLHDALSAMNYAADKSWYIADDNERYRFGTNFVNGEQFYYFATARDLLGRDGDLSPGGLAMACDQLPPDAPTGVTVENFYSFDPNTLSTRQHLKVKWPQSPNTNDTVTAYYIYRWTNSTDASWVGVTNAVANRIAGPIAHLQSQAFNSYVDTGAGSPQAPADYGKTFWYTVRAADNGACAGNLSPNSSPAFGVLRDRTAPGAPDGHINVLCCNPDARSDKDLLVTDSTAADPTLAYYRFVVTTTNKSLAYADFYFVNDNKTNLVGHVAFPSGAAPIIYDWTAKRALTGAGSHLTMARFTAKDGKKTEMVIGSTTALPGAGMRHEVRFLAWLECGRTQVRGECDSHTPINPEDGTTIEPPIVVFTPALTSKEFRLYRRVDGGPMTLIKQGPVTNDPPTQMQMEDPHPPANASVVCYYVQCLDEHGNAGPLTQISDCLKMKIPTGRPILSPLTSLGDTNAPQMMISWFCAPWGVERFEVHIAPGAGNSMPANISPHLTPSPVAQPVAEDVKIGQLGIAANKDFFIYRTPRVGTNFGDRGLFQLPVDIDLNRTYTVFIKPVGLDGSPAADSKNSRGETFKWSEEVAVGPQVPWPARLLPAVATNDFPNWVKPVFINSTNASTNFVGVGIVVGNTDRSSRRRDGVVPPRIDGNDDPLTWVAQSSSGNSLFPLVAYRFQETNSLFPQVSGDVVQVTPMMERIAYKVDNDPSMGQASFVWDPYIDVLSNSQIGLSEGRNSLVLLDTQPVIYGARYRYVLMRFGADGEIAEVIPTPAVDVQ